MWLLLTSYFNDLFLVEFEIWWIVAAVILPCWRENEWTDVNFCFLNYLIAICSGFSKYLTSSLANILHLHCYLFYLLILFSSLSFVSSFVSFKYFSILSIFCFISSLIASNFSHYFLSFYFLNFLFYNFCCFFLFSFLLFSFVNTYSLSLDSYVFSSLSPY